MITLHRPRGCERQGEEALSDDSEGTPVLCLFRIGCSGLGFVGGRLRQRCIQWPHAEVVAKVSLVAVGFGVRPPRLPSGQFPRTPKQKLQDCGQKLWWASNKLGWPTVTPNAKERQVLRARIPELSGSLGEVVNEDGLRSLPTPMSSTRVPSSGELRGAWLAKPPSRRTSRSTSTVVAKPGPRPWPSGRCPLPRSG